MSWPRGVASRAREVGGWQLLLTTTCRHVTALRCAVRRPPNMSEEHLEPHNGTGINNNTTRIKRIGASGADP